MADAAVENIVKEYLNKLKQQGFNISFGVIFGSQALNTASSLSDIDLVVVSPDFNEKLNCKILDNLWITAGRTDSRIEPIPCGRQQWNSENCAPIIDIARKEGQIINLN
jgi:predicted nucleotidyltransferase